MGRYAFFNTGFEYKFWFAVQDSSDMLLFGGRSNLGEVEMFGEEPNHGWEEDQDKEYILTLLHHMEEKFMIPHTDFQSYTMNLEGTQKLYESLSDIKDLDGIVHARYCLACLIYHQILYQPSLGCVYEM